MQPHVLVRESLREISFTHTRIHKHRRRQYKDRAEGELKMLALKTGVMWPQGKEPRHPPEAGPGKAQILPGTSGGSAALLTP